MRNKLILGLALILGLIAALLVYNYLNSINEAAQNKEYTQVVVAIQDIPANTEITSAMLVLKPYPSELKNNQEIVDMNQAIGKISVVPISKGELLLKNRLIKPGESVEQLSYKVPKGFRAISVPVDEVTGVAYMVKQGDRVDVISVVVTDSAVPPRSVVVLQNIEVLAIGTSLSPAGITNPEKTAAPKTVTLAVTLNDSLRLKMALQEGGIALLLRSPADKEISQPAPFALNQF